MFHSRQSSGVGAEAGRFESHGLMYFIVQVVKLIEQCSQVLEVPTVQGLDDAPGLSPFHFPAQKYQSCPQLTPERVRN